MGNSRMTSEQARKNSAKSPWRRGPFLQTKNARKVHEETQKAKTHK